MYGPYVWLRRHATRVGEQLAQRHAGQNVGQLGGVWLELLWQHPELLSYREVRAWLQLEATRGELISAVLPSQAQPVAAQAVLQVGHVQLESIEKLTCAKESIQRH